MAANIQILEKPDWVSWEDIRQCLYDAHSVNRDKGINMQLYHKSPEELYDYIIGANGTMLVALNDSKVVGVGGICERKKKVWFTKGTYALLCLGGIRPEYSGLGIYKRLLQMRERIADERGFSVVLITTHEKNKRIIDITTKNGYKLVGYTIVGDHYNVLMAKWSTGCPYSKIYREYQVCLSWIRVRLCSILRYIKRTVIK